MEDEFKKVIGTPTMMLLPARNYTFKVFEKDHVVTIPRKGKYKDFDDKLFTDKDGEFDILEYIEDVEGFVLFTPSLSKVLFATSQYPDLEDGQAFIPVAIVIKEDEVQIIGNIIHMLKGD